MSYRKMPRGNRGASIGASAVLAFVLATSAIAGETGNYIPEGARPPVRYLAIGKQDYTLKHVGTGANGNYYIRTDSQGQSQLVESRDLVEFAFPEGVTLVTHDGSNVHIDSKGVERVARVPQASPALAPINPLAVLRKASAPDSGVSLLDEPASVGRVSGSVGRVGKYATDQWLVPFFSRLLNAAYDELRAGAELNIDAARQRIIGALPDDLKRSKSERDANVDSVMVALAAGATRLLDLGPALMWTRKERLVDYATCAAVEFAKKPVPSPSRTNLPPTGCRLGK